MRHRSDNNADEIIKVAEDMMCSVLNLSQVGNGCPDLLIGRAGKRGRENILIEVKSEDGELTPDQIKFHREWRGQKAVVRNVAEFLEVMK